MDTFMEAVQPHTPGTTRPEIDSEIGARYPTVERVVGSIRSVIQIIAEAFLDDDDE